MGGGGGGRGDICVVGPSGDASKIFLLWSIDSDEDHQPQGHQGRWLPQSEE